MRKQEIALRYADAVHLIPNAADALPLSPAVLSIQAEFMRLGFVLSREATDVLSTLPERSLQEFYADVLPILASLKGDDVVYEPMYPNFPQQVMEASDAELFLNAILHYWTFGQWKPEYQKLARDFHLESVKFREVGVVGDREFRQIFKRLLSSNDSLSKTDRTAVEWFLRNEEGLEFPDMKFKETLCFVASVLLDQRKDIVGLPKTATDVLRIATALADGDISLAKNTKFPSFPRRVRRALCECLRNMRIDTDDLLRHRGKFVRLFHALHVGEFGLHEVAAVARDRSIKPQTWRGKVETAITKRDLSEAVALLSKRPGEFARRLDHLFRLSDDKNAAQVAAQFGGVADRVPTRILLQLMGHARKRREETSKRVVMPKGGTQRAYMLRNTLPPIPEVASDQLQLSCRQNLLDRFAELPEMGKVFIDSRLDGCPIPTQMRSASEGLFQVARGTRLPIGDDKGTLRFFIYWVGSDIDLSASLHDADLNMIERIAYTNLRSDRYEACHSGDITHAPNGAAEFIDITIDKAVKFGARYVAMNVLVYHGPSFKEHETVYAGWMTREKPNSNEIFDPKTVEQRVSLTSESRNAIPVLFDLVERKAIWVDLALKGRSGWDAGPRWRPGNNVESNRVTIQDNLESILNLDNKISLGELFRLHAEARGAELVETPDEADEVFSLDQGVTPFQTSTINSEYVL